jgi:hypothetical protein
VKSIEECLDSLAGNIWYSKLDANSAYWQVGIKPEDRRKEKDSVHHKDWTF